MVVQHIDIPSGNDPDHRVISSRLSQVKMVMMIIDYGDDDGDDDGDDGGDDDGDDDDGDNNQTTTTILRFNFIS